MSEPNADPMPHFLPIKPEHLPAFQQADHLLTFLRSEAARLEAQLHYVRDAAARSEQEIAGLAQRSYGAVLGSESWIVDAAAGVLRRVIRPAPSAALPVAATEEAPGAGPQ